MRLYRYIGPKRIAERAGATPAGTPIRSKSDLVHWLEETGQQLDSSDSVIATFVVDATGILLIADRRSEHVACAGRAAVRSAGEITIRLTPDPHVVAVSNQSTGYCPEPESWPAVASALKAAGLASPPAFALPCIFRVCPRCRSVNLVKDDDFRCIVCAADLPVEYNCQELPT